MAEKNIYSRENGEEWKIPVFAVIKNGALLKNIFVINKPPSSPLISNPEAVNSLTDDQNTDQEIEEILTVGRHPDCEIVLTHPSISRFHLEIRSSPSSQKLSVIDLSSVHGTWVSEKRIEPRVPVELNEGDTIRVGGSTRVYRLHWVPLTRAYDMDNPFVSPLDVSVEEKIEDNTFLEAENALEAHQNAISVDHNCIEEKGLLLGEREACQDSDFSSLYENSEIYVDKEIPSAPMVSISNTMFNIKGDNKSEDHNLEDLDLVPEGDNKSEDQNQQYDKDVEISPELVTEVISERDNNKSSSRGNNLMKPSSLVGFEEGTLSSSPMPVSNVLFHINGDNLESSNDNEVMEILEIGLGVPLVEGILRDHNKQYDEESHSSPEFVTIFETENQASSPINMYQTSNLVDEVEVQEFGFRSPFPEPVEEVEAKEIGIQSPYEHTMNFYCPEEEFLSEVITKQVDQEESHFDLQPPTERVLEGFFTAGVNSMVNLNYAERREEGENQILSDAHNEEFVSTNLPVMQVLSDITDNGENQTLQSRAVEAVLSDIVEVTEIGFLSPFSEPVEVEANEIEIQTPVEHTRSISKPLSGHLETVSVSLSFLEEECLSEIIGQQVDQAKQNQKSHFDLQPPNLPERHEEGKSQVLLVSHTEESVNSNLPVLQVLSDITDNGDCQTPPSQAVEGILSDKENSRSSPLRSQKRSGTRCIWSRRGKPAAALQVQSSWRRKTRASNYVVADLQEQDSDDKNSVSIHIFCSQEDEMGEEEIFTPEKENLTPNTLLLKSMQKMGKLEEAVHSSKVSSPMLEATFNSKLQLEKNMITYSDKENLHKSMEEQEPISTLRDNVSLDQETLARTTIPERVPFQSLIKNSPRISSTKRKKERASFQSLVANSPLKNETNIEGSCSNKNLGDHKKRWTIVVDTTSLKDKESRKSLELLQGLKGTRLIIPRMVIRELETLKLRASLFRRTTEVSAALEWIEQCLVKSKSWIHVQSSMEDLRATAPTPPAFPKSQFYEYKGMFSCETSSMEIVSPTAEDHILDFVLQNKKLKTDDDQLVLLSNDITLKIKAIAEGIICETAQEFRESLVNPFSERFLWADSSPRGLTWSHLDDVVLKEKYCPNKKSLKGDGVVKGLKLILLHNSQYGQTINSFR